MQVAIQGTHGSFHEIAAKAAFGEGVEIFPCETFSDVFTALQTGQVKKAVVAVGNNHYGDISPVMDFLVRDHAGLATPQFWITGEVYIHITQCLIGLATISLNTIKEIHSQAPAIGQCLAYIRKNIPQAVIVEEDDTAKSVMRIKEWNDPTKVAIASKAAAELYGLQVLAEGIQDDALNITRFLVVEPYYTERAEHTKTTLLLTTDHTPGSLVKALALFSNQSLNFSYIQSLSIPNQPFQYRFYLEIEAGSQDPRVKEVLRVLKEIGYQVDILGSYQIATIPDA